MSTVCVDERSRLIVASPSTWRTPSTCCVVAEGVEDAQVTAEVVALGVDLLQGYYFAKPMPGTQVEGWVRGTTGMTEPVYGIDVVPLDGAQLPPRDVSRRR